MNYTQKNVIFSLFTATIMLSLVFLAPPLFANAASYAYVDAQGEVKMVEANDWRTAIAVAPNIHINSGVFLLTSASDFSAVGDTIPSVK